LASSEHIILPRVTSSVCCKCRFPGAQQRWQRCSWQEASQQRSRACLSDQLFIVHKQRCSTPTGPHAHSNSEALALLWLVAAGIVISGMLHGLCYSR
jgi:hypothetical protein